MNCSILNVGSTEMPVKLKTANKYRAWMNWECNTIYTSYETIYGPILGNLWLV